MFIRFYYDYLHAASADVLPPFVVGEDAQLFERKTLLKHALVLAWLRALEVSQQRIPLLLKRIQRARSHAILLVGAKVLFQLLDARAQPEQLN